MKSSMQCNTQIITSFINTEREIRYNKCVRFISVLVQIFHPNHNHQELQRKSKACICVPLDWRSHAWLTLLDISRCIWVTSPVVMPLSFLTRSNSFLTLFNSLFFSAISSGRRTFVSVDCNNTSCKV